MRGSNGVDFKEGAMKCSRIWPRHAVTICCCYLQYLVRVALVSSTPNGPFSISDSKTQWFRLIFSQNQALASLGASWVASGQKQIGFGGSGPFCTFFDVFCDVKNIGFGQNVLVGRNFN